MCLIYPKIFANFFSAMSQLGVAYSPLKTFCAFLTFSQLFLAYPVLKFQKVEEKEQHLGQKFARHNILIIYL